MSSLTALLSDIVGAAFKACDLPADYGRVTVSNRSDLAQFQCNGALAAAKAAKLPPRQIAERILTQLETHSIFRDLQLAGPGFINISMTDEWLAQQMNHLANDQRLGMPPKEKLTVVLDYGGPNIAKPMHVGHLRAAIIGDSLRRIFSYAGDETIGDVHMGDWGLQMGMLISELEIRHPEMPYFDKANSGPYPATSPVTLRELEELYPT
ncbi:MAG TPA: arginine--tRNA ligase, partial [Dongiaceae bacterium]